MQVSAAAPRSHLRGAAVQRTQLAKVAAIAWTAARVAWVLLIIVAIVVGFAPS
jgi:hypothetical protein